MIDLNLIKKHCRIDHDDEDELLQLYANTAVAHAQNYLGKQIVLDGDAKDDVIVFDNVIATACLLVIAHWYDNRETATTSLQEIPHGFIALLQPYRNMGV